MRADLRFNEEHLWVAQTGNVSRIGLSEHAQKKLGEIVSVNLPKEGDKLEKWESFGEINGEPLYLCPECSFPLFTDQSPAERFLKRRPADYKYCVDCDIGFDLWKYESVENAGHTGCRLRDLTLEEFKEALKLCYKTGCFSDD